MCGTEIAYNAMQYSVLTQPKLRNVRYPGYAVSGSTCDAMSGTEKANGAGQCPVLRQHMRIWCYTMCGTEIANRTTRTQRWSGGSPQVSAPPRANKCLSRNPVELALPEPWQFSFFSLQPGFGKRHVHSQSEI
eukprot:885750-Rhodomonas_salina.3